MECHLTCSGGPIAASAPTLNSKDHGGGSERASATSRGAGRHAPAGRRPGRRMSRRSSAAPLALVSHRVCSAGRRALDEEGPRGRMQSVALGARRGVRSSTPATTCASLMTARPPAASTSVSARTAAPEDPIASTIAAPTGERLSAPFPTPAAKQSLAAPKIHHPPSNPSAPTSSDCALSRAQPRLPRRRPRSAPARPAHDKAAPAHRLPSELGDKGKPA